MSRKKKIFGIFDKRPLIWFHYVLLVGVLFSGYYLGEFLFDLSTTSWYIMFIWFFVVISIGDQIIHKILSVD